MFGPLSGLRQCGHVDILPDELVEETESLRVSLSYTGTLLLNLSQPHTLIHLQDTSIGE